MGMSAGGDSPRAVPYINVTPLIDVLLVLLIIFMVVTPLKPKRFKTLIPEPPENTPQNATAASQGIIRVDIFYDKVDKSCKLQLFRNVDGQMMAQEMDKVMAPENDKAFGYAKLDPKKLGATLVEEFKNRDIKGPYKPDSTVPEKTVFIKAPKNMQYGAVVKIIDALKGAGADPVGLQVDVLD